MATRKKPYGAGFTPGQVAYANIGTKQVAAQGIDINSIPVGQGALYRTYEDPLHPVIMKDKPDPNTAWEYATPAEYRGWAAAQRKARAAGFLHPGESVPFYVNPKDQQRYVASTYGRPGWKPPAAAPAAGPAAAGAGQVGGAPAAGAPPGTYGTGVPPDYSGYLNTDPILAATMRNLQGQDISGQSALVGGAQQLYGRLGEMPTNLPPALAALLGPEQRAALEGAIRAGQNPTPDNPLGAGTSALARLQHDYNQGAAGIGSAYAARGGDSGGYGVHQNELLHDYTLGQYDTRLAAADSLQALQNTYLSGQQERAGQEMTALTEAQQRAGQAISSGYGLPSVNPYLGATTPAASGGWTSAPKMAAPTAPGAAPAAPKPPAPPKPLAAPHVSRLGQTAARSL